MPLKNIECQLAQGQLNRYMGGDGLSESALEQLESHIRECEDCAVYLDEKKRALQAMVAPIAPSSPPKEGSIPTHAVVEFPDEPKPANAFMATLAKKRATLDRAVQPVAASNTPTASQHTPSSFVKPLMYSLGLAAVLIGMSTLMKDPTKLLGDRVEKSNPEAANPIPKTAPAIDSATVAKNEAATNSVVGDPKTDVQTNQSNRATSPTPKTASTMPPNSATDPSRESAGKPSLSNQAPANSKPDTQKTAAPPRRRTQRAPIAARRAPNRVAAKPKAKGIRVYDGTGQPITD